MITGPMQRLRLGTLTEGFWCSALDQHGLLRSLLTLFLLFTTASFATTATADGDGEADDGEVWLQVDTEAQVLKVMQGQQVLRIFEDIAIGRGGPTRDKRRLDGKTPLGEFHISRINNKSSFHRFFGFDYPRLEHADRALKQGYLDTEEYMAISQAIRDGRVPPQNTVLGGHLGIHGIGAGDPQMHRDFNWTNGCIALTNREVDELAKWVQLGVRVVVY